MINAPDKTAPAASRFSDPLLLLFRVLRFLRKKKKLAKYSSLLAKKELSRNTRIRNLRYITVYRIQTRCSFAWILEIPWVRTWEGGEFF